MPKIIDFYPPDSASGMGILCSDPAWLQGTGQSFTAIETYITLDSAKWYLKKVSSPSGYCYAKVYNSTGTPGSTIIPDGEALATSDAYDASTLPTDWTLIPFTFSGVNRITLTPGNIYVLTIEYDGPNYIYSSYDYTAPQHSGNSSYLSEGSWGYDAGDDPFYVYGESVPLPGLIDRNSEANFADYWYISGDVEGGDWLSFGQSFIAIEAYTTVNYAQFFLTLYNNPTGNAYAKIYASTGTHGVDAVPNGTALATSDALDVTTIGPYIDPYELYTFTFSGVNKITLTPGTTYIIAIEFLAGDAGNDVQVGFSLDTAHSGNSCYFDTEWVVGAPYASEEDLIFYLYGDVPLGNIKYFNGADWQLKPLKIYNGATWDNAILKVYDGATWNTV